MKHLVKAAILCSIFTVLCVTCYVFAWSLPGETARHAFDEARSLSITDKPGMTPGEQLPLLAQDGGRYTKLGSGGKVLPVTADHEDDGGPWIMTRDNETGLIWEVKVATEGLRYSGNTYSWYDPDPATNGGYEGTKGGGSCIGSSCDTVSYIEALNSKQFGGFSDWRMPNVREMASLVKTDTFNPAIDAEWFPNTVSNGYWTSTTYVLDRNLAWLVPFYHGLVNHYGCKSGTYYVRAVRKPETADVAYLAH